MVDLSKYIQDMKNQGHSLANIKQHLQKYGYSERDIDHAIYHGKGHGPNLMIPLIIIVILVVIVAGVLFYLNMPKEDIDVNIVTYDKKVMSNSEIKFAIKLEGVKDKKEYEIILDYEVLKSGKRIAMDSENVILIGEERYNVRLDIPDVDEGNYVLKVMIEYKDIKEEDRVGFTVEKEEEIDKTEDVIPEEEDKVTDDDKIIPEEEQTEIKPVVSIWQELENIQELAEQDPNEAARRCSEVKQTYKNKCLQNVAESSKSSQYCEIIEEDIGNDKFYTKDRCYSSVAKDTNQRDLCDKINKDSRRDNCYINFATQGDYTVCNKIVNNYLQKSCKSLETASG